MREENKLNLIIYDKMIMIITYLRTKKMTELSGFALPDELRENLAESYHNYYCPGPGFTDFKPYSR